MVICSGSSQYMYSSTGISGSVSLVHFIIPFVFKHIILLGVPTPTKKEQKTKHVEQFFFFFTIMDLMPVRLYQC